MFYELDFNNFIFINIKIYLRFDNRQYIINYIYIIAYVKLTYTYD